MKLTLLAHRLRLLVGQQVCLEEFAFAVNYLLVLVNPIVFSLTDVRKWISIPLATNRTILRLTILKNSPNPTSSLKTHINQHPTKTPLLGQSSCTNSKNKHRITKTVRARRERRKHSPGKGYVSPQGRGFRSCVYSIRSNLSQWDLFQMGDGLVYENIKQSTNGMNFGFARC